MNPLSDLLQLDDLAFLRAIVERYPEILYLAGEADASPEGAPQLKPDALAYQVFPSDVQVAPTAIEADRTFLGLLTLKWVMNGQYEQLTSLQASSPQRLSRQSFDALRAYTLRTIETEKDLEFCLYYSLACNDLGKTRIMVDVHRVLTGQAAEDHDQLLTRLMQLAPDMFPAYQSLLTPEQKRDYVEGLAANLNLGQFVQGENFPVNLTGMQQVGSKSRDLRLVCELFDFAGATGHISAAGSLTMTEDNYRAFSAAIEELTREPHDQAYHRYMQRRADMVGLGCATPEGYAQTRIAALARAFTPEQGRLIAAVWQGLPESTRATLTRELTITGAQEEGILLYYAPAVIANAIKTAGDFAQGLDYAVRLLTRVYAKTRASDAMKQAKGGVVTVNVADLARHAARTDAQDMLFSGDRLAFIGAGGGSDCIQAAMLALLSGKPACAISVRTGKTTSQGSTGAMGEERSVVDHGGEVTPGVFRITPHTSGSGRFLENLPAALLPVYLVIDAQDGRLRDQLQAALDDFGDVQTVVAVDTGGDCLYRSQVDDMTKATPDQDIRSLEAVSRLDIPRRLSCVIANGVDCPDYADEVLDAASAHKVFFTPEQRARILALYADFKLDGTDPQRYGKTPFAWQAALRGTWGPVTLPLPASVVNAAVNPWNPVVHITPDMAGAWVMSIDDHMAAIGCAPALEPGALVSASVAAKRG